MTKKPDYSIRAKGNALRKHYGKKVRNIPLATTIKFKIDKIEKDEKGFTIFPACPKPFEYKS